MRRILLIVLCVCPLWVCASNTLSLSSASGHPGDIVTIDASMSGMEEVVACEWRIPLGQYLTYVPNSATLNAARSDGHSITAATYNDTLIVSIYSVMLNPIQGTNGVLFSFQLTLGREPATYTLKPKVLLSDENGNPVSASIQNRTVTIITPKISVITSQVDFGHIPIRSTYTKTLQVRNIGNEDLHISETLISNEALSLPQSSWTIAAGQTQRITLTYRPVVRGAISETIRFRSDAINDADVFQANKVTIEADPFSVNELRVNGTTSGISDDTITISLRVNNMEPLVGIQCSFVLSTALEYVANSVAVSARSAQHAVVSAMSNDTLTLMLYSMLNDTIDDYDGEVMTFKLRLNGTNGSYELNPIEVMLSNRTEENMTSASYGATIRINSPRISAPTTVNFGNSPVTEIVTAQYTIRNQGNAALTIERINFLDNGFTVVESLPFKLAQGQSRTITLAYSPTVGGDYSSTMQVYSNDPVNRMHTVSLSGHIYEPNELALDGEQMEDDSYRIHFSLTNYSAIVGLQMDVLMASGVSPSLEPSARLSNHTCLMMPLDNKKYRIMVYSLTNAAIEGNEGDLFDIVYAAGDKSSVHGRQVSVDSVFLSDIDNVQRLTNTSKSHTIKYNYTITWQNEDSSLIDQTTVEYGRIPTHANPVKESTAEYTYTFAGWTPDVVAVTGNATYRAIFNETKNSYTITWQNDDGSLIDKTTVEYGIIPTHADPVKNATAEYTYTFAGWTPDVVAVTGDATYRATFNSVINRYTISVNAVNGEVNGAGEYAYGAEVYLNAIPNEGYTFERWSDGDTNNPRTIIVTSDAEYTALFILSQGIDDVYTTIPVKKLIIGDNIYILHDGKTYTATGARVEEGGIER